MDLIQLGWNAHFEEHFKAFASTNLQPARVAIHHRGSYKVCSVRGELAAEVSGRFRHETNCAADFPAVGDWVALEEFPNGPGMIHAVLSRRSKFSRTAAGETGQEQIVAANIDDLFVVAALSARLNLRRLERSLTLAWEGGADPVIVLTKADLCPDPEKALRQVSEIARGVPVYAVSAQSGVGLAEVEICLRPGRTIALLGPSGVGKSTLINRWCGEERFAVQPVRACDQKGRQTTTHRELVRLASGALVIDTPGMRELQLWEGEEGLAETFDDIAVLARRCRYTDCRHESEPGCAVREAVDSRLLDAARLESHHKLRRELNYFERRHDKRAQSDERKRVKSIMKGMRSLYKGSK